MVEQIPGTPDIHTVDEIQLWRAFREEDIAAWEQIFRLYYSDLYGYGLKLCSRPEMVRDNIQTLFVTLWDQKENISEVRSVKAYLLASLRRQILKALRRERNGQMALLTEEHHLDRQLSAEDRIIEDEFRNYQKRSEERRVGKECRGRWPREE